MSDILPCGFCTNDIVYYIHIPTCLVWEVVVSWNPWVTPFGELVLTYYLFLSDV